MTMKVTSRRGTMFDIISGARVPAGRIMNRPGYLRPSSTVTLRGIS